MADTTRYNVVMTTDELEAQVLSLAPKERARIAKRLLESLESLSEEENEALWIAEAEHRNQEIETGKDVGRPAEDVVEDAESRLK